MQQALDKSRSVKDGEEMETLLDHLIQETRDPMMLKDEVLNVSGPALLCCMFSLLTRRRRPTDPPRGASSEP